MLFKRNTTTKTTKQFKIVNTDQQKKLEEIYYSSFLILYFILNILATTFKYNQEQNFLTENFIPVASLLLLLIKKTPQKNENTIITTLLFLTSILHPLKKNLNWTVPFDTGYIFYTIQFRCIYKMATLYCQNNPEFSNTKTIHTQIFDSIYPKLMHEIHNFEVIALMKYQESKQLSFFEDQFSIIVDKSAKYRQMFTSGTDLTQKVLLSMANKYFSRTQITEVSPYQIRKIEKNCNEKTVLKNSKLRQQSVQFRAIKEQKQFRKEIIMEILEFYS